MFKNFCYASPSNMKPSWCTPLLKSFPKTPHSQFLKKIQLPFNLIFSEKFIQCSRTFAMQIQTAWNEADAPLKQLDNKALWASAEVIKTSANIKKTAQVRNDVASILDKHGVDIWIKALMRLQGHDTSAWCGTFTVKCLCKIWEVPKTMETTIWQKLASWELDKLVKVGWMEPCLCVNYRKVQLHLHLMMGSISNSVQG
jgi:hypothetical protein